MTEQDLRAILERPRKLWDEYTRAKQSAETVADVLAAFLDYLAAWLDALQLITGAGYIRHADALVNRYLNRGTWKDYTRANHCDRKTYYRHSLAALQELRRAYCGYTSGGDDDGHGAHPGEGRGSAAKGV